MSIDLESEPTARLLSRILKVETVLAIAAAVFLTASVVPSRKAHLSTDSPDYGNSATETGKPSPFSDAKPKRPVSHQSQVRDLPAPLPAIQERRNYLPDSVATRLPAAQLPDLSPSN